MPISGCWASWVQSQTLTHQDSEELGFAQRTLGPRNFSLCNGFTIQGITSVSPCF